MSNLTYCLYENLGAYFLHLDGCCQEFHDRGEQCPCEYWDYVGVVALPQGYFVDHFDQMVDTGFVVTFKDKAYSVISVGDYVPPKKV